MHSLSCYILKHGSYCQGYSCFGSGRVDDSTTICIHVNVRILFPILNYITVGGDILSVVKVIHVRELAFF